jgi:hypothetical protein
MAADFKRGDHVEWNSEARRVRGTIRKKVTREIVFKGYKRHASKEEPPYISKNDQTDHLAIHNGSALKTVKKSKREFIVGRRPLDTCLSEAGRSMAHTRPTTGRKPPIEGRGHRVLSWRFEGAG